MTLQGQVALITGAGRPGGLGLAIATRLATDGARIVLHDRGPLRATLLLPTASAAPLILREQPTAYGQRAHRSSP